MFFFFFLLSMSVVGPLENFFGKLRLTELDRVSWAYTAIDCSDLMGWCVCGFTAILRLT